MADIIEVLPDSVANQIAAGEVIQRPASVVKELVENAVDAGGKTIKIIVKDAGKTLVQIIDNGCGMSETDARMAFERHATSKIRTAHDIFAIRTLGFRGEALASIAAVAQVELRTRRVEDELGTQICTSGSQVESQDVVSCPSGSNFLIKNLFFNIPARRKFLKTNSTEFRHILNEFHRIVLTHPEVGFSLYHNDSEVYHLPEGNLRQRIINVFGKKLNSQLIRVETETSIVTISGFIGKPEFARKRQGEQFFFVNGRYMRHGYFHKAIMESYDRLLAPECLPSYFIYFDIDPSFIDVNIHPTKTEIKFEDERSIWVILQAAIKESLGKFNVVPSIDFDQAGSVDIPLASIEDNVAPPTIEINPAFNPFQQEANSTGGSSPEINTSSRGSSIPQSSDNSFNTPSSWEGNRNNQPDVEGWETLYQGFENGRSEPKEVSIEDQSFPEPSNTVFPQDTLLGQGGNFFQLKGRYILTAVRSGLMMVDQHRAHIRILFEQFLNSIKEQRGFSQQCLFPEEIEMDAHDVVLLEEIRDDLEHLGFDIRKTDEKTYQIAGIPSGLEDKPPLMLVESLLETARTEGIRVREKLQEQLAFNLARASSIPYGQQLAQEEMEVLIDNLFACELPNYGPDGKAVLQIVPNEEIEKKFN